MKTNKIISYTLISYIIIDLIHYFLIRNNYGLVETETNDFFLTESYYESKEITFIKLTLCVMALLGLVFSNKNKKFNYLILLSSLGMIYLVIFRGPLYYFFLWYSKISLWFLFFLGLFLIYLSFVRLRRKE